jgi:hypothetical protein
MEFSLVLGTSWTRYHWDNCRVKKREYCRAFVEKLEHVVYTDIWYIIYVRGVKEIGGIKCKLMVFDVLI